MSRTTLDAKSMGGASLLVTVSIGALLASCNAVFGLEDRSFGAGGGGGSGGSTASGTSTGSCGPEDIVRGGDFDPGWEASWEGNDLTLTTQDEDGQPVLRAVVVDSSVGDGDEGDLFHDPQTPPACTDPCVSLAFSFYAITDFDLNVYIETDVDGRRLGLFSLDADSDAGFVPLDGGPACRLPADFTIDRLVFQAYEPGSYLLDDVKLEIRECASEALDCTAI